MKNLQQIGRAIAMWKDKRGLTTVELARLSGVSHSCVAGMLGGERDSGITKYMAVAEALGTTIGQLVYSADDLADDLADDDENLVQGKSI